jgi:hypothetical protein
MSFSLQVYAPGRAGSLSKSRPCRQRTPPSPQTTTIKQANPIPLRSAITASDAAAYTRQGRLISAWPSVLLNGDFHWRSIRGTF